MRVQYWCKHCNHFVGEWIQPAWSRQEIEHFCGFDRLSPVERTETIDYNDGEDTMYVKTVCEYCQGAVETHPELLVEGKLLQ